jgi:hypothetical protein
MVRFGYRNENGSFTIFDCTGVEGSLETGEATFYSYDRVAFKVGKNKDNIEKVKQAIDKISKNEDIMFG